MGQLTKNEVFALAVQRYSDAVYRAAVHNCRCTADAEDVVQDVEAIDADPAALGRRLVGSPAGKCWLTHPKAETFLAERVALLQRVYRR